jgi:hypothetical protein
VINKDTPHHIKLFIQWYCESNHCKYASAEQIKSAITGYYRYVKYFPDGWNYETGVGNPGDSNMLKTFMIGFKNK